MKFFLKTIVIGSVVSTASFGAAQAATINIVTVDGDAQETVYGIRTDGNKTNTYGYELAGATVTATYADAPSEDIVWAAIPYSATGVADGTHTDLSMDWAGFVMTTTRLLTSLSFDFTSVDSVFDVNRAGPTVDGNTPTSHVGFPFRITAGGDSLVGSVTATYSGIINLVGRPADGDLYSKMFVDFSGLSTGGFIGDMTFNSDIDTLAVAGDLVPVVPLPASFPFLLAGLAALGLVSGRMSRHSSKT